MRGSQLGTYGPVVGLSWALFLVLSKTEVRFGAQGIDLNRTRVSPGYLS